MTTPRAIKRKVIPIIPDEEEEDVPEPLAAAVSSQIIPNSESEEDAIIKLANLGEKEKVVEVEGEDEGEDEEEVLSPVEEERLRIWDIFSEEYHDSKFVVVCCLLFLFRVYDY